MNIEDRIKTVKKKIREAQNEQIRLRTLLQQLNAQKEEIINECKDKGFNPNTLQEDLKKYEIELDNIVASLESLLSGSQKAPF